MPHVVIANYERERELFKELLNPASSLRILLLHGESGIGKSYLLRSCVDLVPENVRCIPIELRGTAVSVAEIFYRLGSHIGWDELAHFRRRLSSADLRSTVEAARNVVAGIRNQLTVSLYSHDLLDRSERI